MAPSTVKSDKSQQAQQTQNPANKDNMSIGSAESLAPRWVSPTNASNTADGHTIIGKNQIHWVGILRDDTMLVEFCNEPDNPKILQMSRRFLKKKSTSSEQGADPKVDWEFKTYAVQSQRRMVHAVKFTIYDKIPLAPGARAKLVHLKQQTFLNGETVRVIEYQKNTDKYLIRPSIPLPEAQKLATTGMLVVHANHLVAQEQQIRTWTFSVLYDGKQLSQNAACQFLERILMISENFRVSDDSWNVGGEMSCQEQFAPILSAQMEQFVAEPVSIDESLEYTKELIEKNMDIISNQSSALHQV